MTKSSVKLSNGLTVEFHPVITRRMNKEYTKNFNKGVKFKMERRIDPKSGEEVNEAVVDSMEPDALDKANEAFLIAFIKGVSNDKGEPVEPNQDFIDTLPEPDYQKLVQCVTDARKDMETEIAKGKKNSK